MENLIIGLIKQFYNENNNKRHKNEIKESPMFLFEVIFGKNLAMKYHDLFSLEKEKFIINYGEENPKSEDKNFKEEVEEKEEEENKNQNPDTAQLNNNRSTKKLLHTMPKIKPQNTADEVLNQISSKNNKSKEKQNKKEISNGKRTRFFD